MHMIPVAPAASLAIAALTVAAAALASVITRTVLCMLAVSATRKALEDLADGQADADALRAHRLAVLRAILASLSGRGQPGPCPYQADCAGKRGRPLARLGVFI